MPLTYGPPRCADCGVEIKNGAQRCKPCQCEHARAWWRAYYAAHRQAEKERRVKREANRG